MDRLVLLSEDGASRYGLTPIWFNHRMPSCVTFHISDPGQFDPYNRPERERAIGQPTYVGVRDFRLGMMTATCYEYRRIYVPESSSSLLRPHVLWESLCYTRPNGIDYNLRSGFAGPREDLNAFYKVLNSATPQ